MKARSFIVRALLFAVVLAPSALRTWAKPLGASSCRVAKTQLQVSRMSRQNGEAKLVATLPRHHAPAPRLHRIRGKKISIQAGLVLTARSYSPTHFLIKDALVSQQDLNGPNPSRGPPSLFFL